VLVFLLFAIAGLYIHFNIVKFYKSFILDNLLDNLTVFESKMSRRLTYLWSTDRITLFNPFNKGFQRNLEELWINFLDIDIYADYKNYVSQNLGEVFDDEKDEEEDPNYFYNIGGFKLILKLSDHVDPFVSSKGNIYKFVDGKEIINWNRLMVFTAFDVINSPFKDMMIKRAKFSLNEYKKRELYMKMAELMEKNKEKDEDNEDNEENEKDEDNKDNEKDEDNKDNEKKENNEDKKEDNEDKKEDNEDNEKKEDNEDNEKNESDDNKEKLDDNENDKSEEN
jgi:flagellar biosynthesis GTPase FlhF